MISDWIALPFFNPEPVFAFMHISWHNLGPGMMGNFDPLVVVIDGNGYGTDGRVELGIQVN
ncbi:MAG: hypothetical protein HKM93_23205 [Desulfobacteraceae bacterium]|nr:hypothetical protein [Desulfobacteraceae bacterium]